MFGNNNRFEKANQELAARVAELESELNDSEKALSQAKKELKDYRSDVEFSARMNREKAESDMSILRSELASQIREQTAGLQKDLSDMREKKGIVEAQNAVYKSAMENMGFDVKDMKEILNKLVDGIVSKNEIKVLNNK